MTLREISSHRPPLGKTGGVPAIQLTLLTPFYLLCLVEFHANTLQEYSLLPFSCPSQRGKLLPIIHKKKILPTSKGRPSVINTLKMNYFTSGMFLKHAPTLSLIKSSFFFFFFKLNMHSLQTYLISGVVPPWASDEE